MVWASQATSRCQGDTGTSEFVGSDGRTTAQVTWENVPAAPAGARGQRDAPGWQGTSEQWAPVGAGRGGQGRARSPCAATAQLPGGARHQRGGRGLRAGLRHPTSGAPRRPGPPLAPATGALAQHSAWWLPGPCSPGGATRLGSTWGWLPGLRGRSTPHKAGSRRRMAPLPTSRPSVRAVPKPSCLIEYNTPPGTGVREPGRRAPPRPAPLCVWGLRAAGPGGVLRPCFSAGPLMPALPQRRSPGCGQWGVCLEPSTLLRPTAGPPPGRRDA